MLMGLSWIGNGVGVVGVGQLNVSLGSYQVAMMICATLRVIGSLLIGFVRLPPRDQREAAVA